MTGSIVALCIHGVGHLQCMLPLIAALCDRGLTVHVLTHADFRFTVERAGGHFIDLFTKFPLEEADATSIPVPSRYVSFAGVYAERLTAEVAALSPQLILYDTFMVVGPLIAQRLGIPSVNVSTNHAAVPARVVAELHKDPRVAISAQCFQAVRRLQEAHGMRSANPFSYVEALSPFLNIYCQPEEFLDGADRAAFEPLAFFGSLAPALQDQRQTQLFSATRGGLRIYVSFGTVIWGYFEAAACAALRVIASACAQFDAQLLIGLGNHQLSQSIRDELSHFNLRIMDYVPQWSVLSEADVFVTHHGTNSTHEAIFHEVPMISYPFFGDQPALARRCQDLGLAVALSTTPRAPVEPGAFQQALQRTRDDHAGFAARLAEAHQWELRTIAQRPAIIDRMLSLI